MEVLNATGLAVVSAHKHTVCADRRIVEPRKLFSLVSLPCPSRLFSPHLRSGLVLLSNVLGGTAAKALTYEEALEQSVGRSAAGVSSLDFDVSGLVDGIIKFGVENPPIVAGGFAALAIPLLLSQILKKSKPWGVESARNAYAKLSEDASAQLLDIRSRKDLREVGCPDLRSLKKKAVVIQYDGRDKPSFLRKLCLKFKDPENTTLFVLDKFDGSSELVAELATLNGFKAAFAIKDGAEGPRGWKSRLPWIQPKKALGLDFGDLTDALSAALGEDALSLTLGVAAVAGLGALAFTEVETVLQLLGSAALVQIVTKKLLFAEDRKKALKEVDEFLTTKIAPAGLLDEIKMIGKALLPASVGGQAFLPTHAEGDPSINPSSSLTEKANEASQVTNKAKAEAAVINSIPRAEVQEESISGLQTPLSPYPYYPDFKPPASPSPSQP